MKNDLKTLCLTDTNTITAYLTKKFNNSEISGKGGYIYLDRGEESKVLFVCHLDTVSSPYTTKTKSGKRDTHFETRYNKKWGEYVTSIALDDRLGLWAGLTQFPALTYDILLTLDEEIGASTAQYFQTEKEYNWVFSFDRHGINPVLYQYDTPKLRKMLKSVGYKIDYGSFSDIAYLDHLGVSGINFGIGYHNEHSSKCYAYMSDIKYCLDTFAEFYNKYKDVKMPYTPPKVRYHKGYTFVLDEDWENTQHFACIVCGMKLKPDEHTCCISCQQYLDRIDGDFDNTFGEEETANPDRKYVGYCDVCNCDLELTEDDMSRDVIMCANCTKRYRQHLEDI